MQTLATILRKRLDDAKKIAVLGIGSELRADDAAGLLVAKQIRMSFPQSQRVKIFLGHTAPENLISQIKKFKPLHLIIIDALDMAKRPGDRCCCRGRSRDLGIIAIYWIGSPVTWTSSMFQPALVTELSVGPIPQRK